MERGHSGQMYFPQRTGKYRQRQEPLKLTPALLSLFLVSLLGLPSSTVFKVVLGCSFWFWSYCLLLMMTDHDDAVVMPLVAVAVVVIALQRKNKTQG